MNELKIELGGKERLFSFGLAFLGELLEHFDMDMAELGAKMARNPFKYQPLIMFLSAKHACELNDIEMDFTHSDVISWVEAEPFGIKSDKATKFDACLVESLYKNVPKQDETQDKKKVKK